MYSTAFFAFLLASVFNTATADVTPNEPGPGDSFNQGATCHIAWVGDTLSTTAWKDMSIELMSGSNLGMVHITTITTGQDGTVSGSFDYTCPEVIPNSAIYFYQFTGPHTTNVTWTTRFTIASATGESTDPENPTQPGSNDPIPWGIGALADPSKAVAAPSYSGAASTAGATVAGSSSSSTIIATTTETTTTRRTATFSTARSTDASSTSSPSPSTSPNAAKGLVADTHLFNGALALAVSASFITAFL